MKRALIIAGVAVVVTGLAVAAMVPGRKAKDTAAQTGASNEPVEARPNDSDFWCTYKNKKGDGSGIIYVSGTNFRNDFTGGDKSESHMAADGEYYYTWSNRGLPLKVAIKSVYEDTATDAAKRVLETQLNQQDKVGLACLRWTVNKQQLAIPENIQFIDLTPKLLELRSQRGATVGSSRTDTLLP